MPALAACVPHETNTQLVTADPSDAEDDDDEKNLTCSRAHSSVHLYVIAA